jgi:hypothetical protein
MVAHLLFAETQVVVNPIPAGCAAFFNSTHTPDLSVAPEDPV